MEGEGRKRCWAATSAAAASLDADLPYPLSATLAQAIEALQRQPFSARIRAARERLAQHSSGQDHKEET